MGTLVEIARTVTLSPTSTAAIILESQINQLILVSYPDFSGTILVAIPGEDPIMLSYGLADREHHVPNTAETKFEIASITKSFTAMAIMILEDRGSLKVDDPIWVCLPYHSLSGRSNNHNRPDKL